MLPENPCIAHDCHVCCLETEMPLTSADMERICTGTGMGVEEYTVDADDWSVLRNVDGRCYFLDREGRCRIYGIRPEGCRYYPFIFYEKGGNVMEDEDCPYSGEFSRSNEIVRGVRALVERLEKERGREG
jgi:Fe-S-cluster containining protein